jgi:hypothetical protein
MPFTDMSEQLNRSEEAGFDNLEISRISRAAMKHMVQSGSYVGQNALFISWAMRQIVEYKGSDCQSKRATPNRKRNWLDVFNPKIQDWKWLHPNAAGIDVGNSAHYVAVSPDRDSESVRRFDRFTADLYCMAAWLKSRGVKTVAMQSTGVYWIPLYDILEMQGFQVFLVNARYTKNLPGRKTDVQESQWMLELHTYGLLSNSFRPPAEIRIMRTYWRQRGD